MQDTVSCARRTKASRHFLAIFELRSSIPWWEEVPMVLDMNQRKPIQSPISVSVLYFLLFLGLASGLFPRFSESILYEFPFFFFSIFSFAGFLACLAAIISISEVWGSFFEASFANVCAEPAHCVETFELS